MVSQVNDSCLQTEASEKAPAYLVFTDTLRELYWSKNQLIRTLLKMENAAVNAQLRRAIHNYFEISRTQVYSIEHIFELFDEAPEGTTCAITESTCRQIANILNAEGLSGADKSIRSAAAEFFAQEITAYQFLKKLAITVRRLDIVRILNEMQRQTRIAFESAFPGQGITSDIAA